MKACLAFLALAACSQQSSHHVVTPAAPTGKAVDPAAALATKSEDITLTVGTRSVPGTIVAPTDAGPWPAMLLIAGSGPTDRNWNSKLLPAQNGSGKLLAEELAKHGMVVIRFDKAGSGENPGPPLAEFTLDTYRDEDQAALALVRSRSDVRKDRVFVAGHSEGGLHATRLALASSNDLAGVLYLSSASRSLSDTMLTQLEGNLRNPMAGLSEDQIKAEMGSLRAAFTDFLAGKPVDPKKASAIPPLQQLVAGIVAPQTAGLMRGLLGYDNAAEAPKVMLPVLIVNGGKDVQVDPELDAKHLHAAFLAAKRDATLHIAPEADHVLKHETRSVADIRKDLKATQDAYNAEGRVLDADLVGAVVGWLAEHTR
jgi:hypothetical protein